MRAIMASGDFNSETGRAAALKRHNDSEPAKLRKRILELLEQEAPTAVKALGEIYRQEGAFRFMQAYGALAKMVLPAVKPEENNNDTQIVLVAQVGDQEQAQQLTQIGVKKEDTKNEQDAND